MRHERPIEEGGALGVSPQGLTRVRAGDGMRQLPATDAITYQGRRCPATCGAEAAYKPIRPGWQHSAPGGEYNGTVRGIGNVVLKGAARATPAAAPGQPSQAAT